MSNQYLINLASNTVLVRMAEKGLISVDFDDQEIRFKDTRHFKIKPLYVEEGEDGAMVVVLNEMKYVFYLQDFGQINKIYSTASSIKSIVAGLLDNNSGAESYLLSMGGCSAIQIIDEGRKIESTSIFSKNVINNIRWLSRGIFKSELQKNKLDA